MGARMLDSIYYMAIQFFETSRCAQNHLVFVIMHGSCGHLSITLLNM